MAEFVVFKRPDPRFLKALYGALLNEGLLQNPAVSFATWAKGADAWGDVESAQVKGAVQLEALFLNQPELTLLAWGGSGIETQQDIFAVTRGEIHPFLTRKMLEELPDELAPVLASQTALLARWISGRSWLNRIIGDLSRFTPESARALELEMDAPAKPGTRVAERFRIPPRPTGKMVREDLAPEFATTSVVAAFLERRAPTVHVIAGGKTEIVRGASGLTAFLTSSLKVGRALGATTGVTHVPVDRAQAFAFSLIG